MALGWSWTTGSTNKTDAFRKRTSTSILMNQGAIAVYYYDIFLNIDIYIYF